MSSEKEIEQENKGPSTVGPATLRTGSIGESESVFARQGKRETIMADIRAQVADGRLKPGDKLLSVSALRDLYGVSHQTAAFAMADLVREGVICSLPRKGYFVTARSDSPASGSENDAHALHPVFDAADKMTQVFYSRRRAISLYVMDSHPDHILAWRAALAAFERDHPLLRVTPIFPNEGSPVEILRRRTVDIVHAPHDVLRHDLPDRWMPVTDLRTAGLTPDEVLPIVNAIKNRDQYLVGAPLSLTTRYLYVNLDLYHRLYPGEVKLASPDAILDTALEFERSAAGPDEFGLWPDKLFEELVLLETVDIEPGGRFRLNADRLRHLIPRLAQLRRVGLQSPLAAFSQIEQFRLKRALFCWQFSFNAPSFNLVPDLNWTALAPPSQCASPIEAYLTVLAIDRQTDFPGECQELVRYLCSEPVMAGLDRVPALLPVRRRVLEHWSGSTHITRETVEEVVRRFSALWPVMDHAAWDRVDTCGYRFVDGTMNPDALLAALQPSVGECGVE